jgi:replication initiation protein RepC
VEAYGFDLSPLAARYAEFVRLAEEGRAEREAMGRLRRRGTIARKGIVQILETARDYDLTGEDWAAQESDAKMIVQALRRVERADEMEAGVASLEQRQRGSPHPPRNATARC